MRVLRTIADVILYIYDQIWRAIRGFFTSRQIPFKFKLGFIVVFIVVFFANVAPVTGQKILLTLWSNTFQFLHPIGGTLIAFAIIWLFWPWKKKK